MNVNGGSTSGPTPEKLEERLSQIRSQPKLQSQQQTAVVLSAVEDTLKDQKSGLTPAAYFAALLSLLSQHVSASNGVANKDVATAVVYLLDLVTPNVPTPLLRSKFAPILSNLSPALNQSDADAPFLRSSIGCLVSLLVVQDNQAWALPQSQDGPRKALALLLRLAMDHRPKVRKRAQEGITTVLSNGPPNPSLDHPAADMCAETALRSFEALAVSQSKQGRQQNQAQQHEPAMIHAMQLVKTLATAGGGWPSRNLDSLAAVLFAAAKSRSEYLTTSAFDVFETVFEGMANDETFSKLPRLLETMMEIQPSQNDSQLLPPWLAVISRGYDVYAQMDPDETFQKLPQIIERVSTFLASPAYNIRVSASECLISFLVNCIPVSVVIEPSIYDEKNLEKLGNIVSKLFDVKYQSARMEVFNVVSAIFENLRWRCDPVMRGIVKTVGDLRASDAFQNKEKANEVLAKAIRYMGAEPVLEVLPLNLATSGSGQQGRAWLVPLLRDNVTNTHLMHFKTELVPLSEKLFQRVLDQAGQQKTMEVKIFETLVQQIWSCLPGYCDRPLDVMQAFDQAFAEMIAKLLYQQTEMRVNLCRALQNLVESFKIIVDAEGAEDVIAQGRITRANAQDSLDYLSTYASNLLAVLFNVYGETTPQHRGPLLSCINAYLSITKSTELSDTFDKVVSLLDASISENAEKASKDQMSKEQQKPNRLPPTSHALMDIIVTMAIYLPRESFQRLFAVASTIISQQGEPQLQKKAYKLLPRLSLSETGRSALQDRNADLQKLLLDNAEPTLAPARKDRLLAITEVVKTLPSSDLHFIPCILPEVILRTKENNERARESAFSLIITMGDRMIAGGTVDNARVTNAPSTAPAVPATISEYFTILSTGLAGTTPHMISATVTALSAALFHFHAALPTAALNDLLDTLSLFLTSPTREVVRSVLGFVKIAIISLPPPLMEPRLPELIPSLLNWSHEHKANFRSKVKNILERIIRRFGIEVVQRYCPEADRKLVAGIRKARDRAKRKKTAGAIDDNDDDAATTKPGRAKFANEFDEAVYGSDDSASASNDDDNDAEGGVAVSLRDQKRPRSHAWNSDHKTNNKTARAKGAEAYIHEDSDSPLDLLSPRALGHISSTKPLRTATVPKRGSQNGAKMDVDGKLVFRGAGGNEGGDDNDNDAEMMDFDDSGNAVGGAREGAKAGAGGIEQGVDAYVQAIRGKHAAVRGQRGKLKFGAKRSRDAVADDNGDGEANSAGGAGRADGGRGDGGSGGRGGRGGDRRGGPRMKKGDRRGGAGAGSRGGDRGGGAGARVHGTRGGKVAKRGGGFRGRR